MKEHKLSSKLDYYAEYSTLSKILVNSGAMIDNYNYYNAPKYRVNIIEMIKPYLSHEYNLINEWQSLSPDFDTSVMILMVLRIIRLPPDFRNFKALYLSNTTFSRYSFYTSFA